MNLKTRRIISFIFILVFLGLTPPIMFYAAGYKIGWNFFSIRRTGMFIIESFPKGAKILLNGKAQKNFISFKKNNYIITPAKIKSLLPGEYDISLELDGHIGWRKKLAIYPGASTYIDAWLFKKDLPVEIRRAEIKKIKFSPDGKKTLVKSDIGLELVNLAAETNESINLKSSPADNLYWSTDGENLIIDNILYNFDNLNYALDLGELSTGAFNYKWNGNNLYFQNKEAVYQLVSEKNLNLIIKNPLIKDYLVKGDNLYLISGHGQTSSLAVLNLSNRQPVKEINLLDSPDYSFINPGHELLNVYDSYHKILYLIGPGPDYLSATMEIINNIENSAWHDGVNLIYSNDFEIWLFNLKTKEKILITRISDQIKKAIMLPSQNNIIFSTSQTIKTIELDGRDSRNINELARFDSIGDFSLSPKGDLIYFSGKIGNSQGLYKLAIQ